MFSRLLELVQDPKTNVFLAGRPTTRSNLLEVMK